MIWRLQKISFSTNSNLEFNSESSTFMRKLADLHFSFTDAGRVIRDDEGRSRLQGPLGSPASRSD